MTRQGCRWLLLSLLIALCWAVAACAPSAADLPPAPTPTPIPAARSLELVGSKQTKNLTCESQSAADLLKFWGIAVGEMEFFNKLPRSDNPTKGFVGSPDSPPGSLPPNGYGVYAAPVAETLRRFGLDAEATSNQGVNWLRQELAADRPVMVWSTYGFKDQPVKTYTARDGQTVDIVQFEHTFLAVGYDANGIAVVDPLDGARKTIPYGEFVRGWNLLGQMAVTARLPAPAATPVDTAPTHSPPPAWVPLVALLLLAFGILSLRGRGRARRGQQTLAHTVAVPAARLTPDLRGWRAPRPSSARVRARLAPLEQRASRWSASPLARPLPLALVGIAVGLVALFFVGAVSPCFTLPVLAIGAGLGFWVGLWLQTGLKIES